MHVTKKTAHKLASAGYPQPKSGGAWYADDLGETISTAMQGAVDWQRLPGAVYAPNVVDLLEAMTGRCLLSHANDKWEAHIRANDISYGINFYHDNPAEALAEAYLHINQPPQ